MSEGYQMYDQNVLYFLTFQVVDWVDIFTRAAYKEVIVQSLGLRQAGCNRTSVAEIRELWFRVNAEMTLKPGQSTCVLLKVLSLAALRLRTGREHWFGPIEP